MLQMPWAAAMPQQLPPGASDGAAGTPAPACPVRAPTVELVAVSVTSPHAMRYSTNNRVSRGFQAAIPSEFHFQERTRPPKFTNRPWINTPRGARAGGAHVLRGRGETGQERKFSLLPCFFHRAGAKRIFAPALPGLVFSSHEHDCPRIFVWIFVCTVPVGSTACQKSMAVTSDAVPRSRARHCISLLPRGRSEIQ